MAGLAGVARNKAPGLEQQTHARITTAQDHAYLWKLLRATFGRRIVLLHLDAISRFNTANNWTGRPTWELSSGCSWDSQCLKMLILKAGPWDKQSFVKKGIASSWSGNYFPLFSDSPYV
jgi:hypothetical protein